MATYSNSAREVEMPDGNVVVLHSEPTGGANSTSNIKKFTYDDNGHVTASSAADAEDLNLDSYSTPTTGTTAIGTSDSVQTAIGKLDHQSQIDQTNILLVEKSNPMCNELSYNMEDLKKINSSDYSWSYNVASLSGIEFTINEDNSISWVATNLASTAWLILYDSTEMPAIASDEYVLHGCPSGGGMNTYELEAVVGGSDKKEYGDSTSFTVNNNLTLVAIGIRAGSSSGTFYPVLINKSLYDAGITEYVPPAKQNSDLTQFQAEDRAELVELVDSGAKNKLDWNNVIISEYSCTYTKTSTSITVADGTSAYSHVMFGTPKLEKASRAVFSFSVSAVTAASGSRVMVQIYNNASASGNPITDVRITSTGKYSLEWNAAANTSYYIFVYVSRDSIQSGNTVTITDLMVCTKAAFGVSQKFVPYRPNYDLVLSDISLLSHRIYEFATTGTQTRSFILKRLYGTSNTRCPLQFVYASQDPSSVPVVLYTQLFLAGETNSTPTLSRSAMCFSAGMINQSNPIPQPYPAVWFKPDTTKQWLYITVNFGYSNLWAAGYFKIENSNDQITIDTTNGVDISSDSGATQMTIYHPTFTS